MKPAALAAVVIALAASSASADDAAPVQVMILGVYHLGNPGRDLHNVTADDVTRPRRQAELAELAARLERFKPTRVAVEAKVDAADLKLAAYRRFKLADLAKSRNETSQIGFRIARDLGHREVYGIDEQSDTIDYFPYGKLQAYARRTGGAAAAELAALNDKIEADVKAFSASQQTRSIAQLLAQLNDPARVQADQGLYYRMLMLGDTKAQPGADLNAAWYLRNAKIFVKLTQIARPGDRVLVVFGAGHGYWLRHFVATAPGYQLVEANDYLTAAK